MTRERMEMRGVITAWFLGRGFGWADMEDGKTAFVHISEVAGGTPPESGSHIEADLIIQTHRGPKAVRVREIQD